MGEKREKPSREVLFELYVTQELSSMLIGDRLGYAPQTIQKWLKKMDIPRRRRGPRSGEKHPGWRGGLTTDKSGYILQHQPDHPCANSSGYVRQHRLVMEQHLGRYLTKQEVVHHKNDVRDDNRIENLELFENNGSHLSGTLTRCPNWSPEGRRKLLETAAKKRVKLPDQDVLVDMLKTKTTGDVARMFGCSTGAVRNHMRRLGVPPQPIGRRKKVQPS